MLFRSGFTTEGVGTSACGTLTIVSVAETTSAPGAEALLSDAALLACSIARIDPLDWAINELDWLITGAGTIDATRGCGVSGMVRRTDCAAGDPDGLDLLNTEVADATLCCGVSGVVRMTDCAVGDRDGLDWLKPGVTEATLACGISGLVRMTDCTEEDPLD